MCNKGKVQPGYIFTNNQGEEFTVLSRSNRMDNRGYCSYWNVQFKDNHGYTTTSTHSSILNGRVKNPFHPFVVGVGYFGDGPFESTYYTPDGIRKRYREYIVWLGLMQRCYSDLYHINHPTYKDCTVDTTWHNFQTFAAWYTSQYGHDLDYFELDKDLLIYNNKHYSPSSCVLIPAEINSMLARAYEETSTLGLPTGYSYTPRNDIYARVIHPVRGRIGKTFKTLREAIIWRNDIVEYKIAYILEKYSLVVPTELLDLIEYRLETLFLIEPDDWVGVV